MATHRPVAELATRLRLRPSVEKLSAPQLQRLKDAIGRMARISDDRGYQYFARLHGGPPRAFCHHGAFNAAGVYQGAPLFLPWHRAYLHFFELAMQDQVADVTLAWWDWSSPRSHADGLPPGYVEGGARNPLTSQPIAEGFRRPRAIPAQTSRDPGDPADLPLPADVRRIIDLPSFGDFSSQLENLLHNKLHGWVGGAMGQVPIAAFDPVFWAHHTMVDRIWRLWQLRHGRPGPGSASMGIVLDPFPITVGGVVDATHLGYDYAGSATGAPGTVS
jgi:tyrosinase